VKVESKTVTKEVKKEVIVEAKGPENKIVNVSVEKKEVQIQDEEVKSSESFGMMVQKDKAQRKFHENQVQNKDLEEKNQ